MATRNHKWHAICRDYQLGRCKQGEDCPRWHIKPDILQFIQKNPNALEESVLQAQASQRERLNLENRVKQLRKFKNDKIEEHEIKNAESNTNYENMNYK